MDSDFEVEELFGEEGVFLSRIGTKARPDGGLLHRVHDRTAIRRVEQVHRIVITGEDGNPF
jgi:hypothetical protein